MRIWLPGLFFLLIMMAGCENRDYSARSHDKVEVWLDAGPELLTMLRDEVKNRQSDFPGLRVNFRVFRFEDLKPAILGSISAVEKPDIFMFSSDWLGEMVQAGLIASVTLPAQEYLSVASEAMFFNGSYWGYPWSLDTIALIINRDLVKNAPEDLQQMIDLKNHLPNGVYPLLYDNKNFYYHAPWFHAFGASVFDEKGFSVDGPEAVAAFDFAYELETIHELVPEKANQAAAINLFCAGKLAMTINGPWAIPEFIKNRVNFSVVPIPGPDSQKVSRPLVGIKGLAIASQSAAKPGAEKVMSLIAGQSFLQRAAEKSMFIPCLKSSGQNDLIKGFVEQAQNGVLMPSRPEMRYVWSEMNRALRLKFSEKRSSAEILSETRARLDSAVKKAGRDQ
ncbi:MAG: extracellular solute-binding protein [Candidatus Riflebacteria bacterium]